MPADPAQRIDRGILQNRPQAGRPASAYAQWIEGWVI
jgi:hypothetical protein